MKGVIFTEFLEFVASEWGVEMVDAIIEDCELSTGGAYTAVGVYPVAEFERLVAALSLRVDIAVAALLRGFGRRMCERLVAGHAEYFERAANLFDLLASIGDHIHVDVQKIHPDAVPPSFTVASRRQDVLCLDYRSQRRLDEFALGMIEGAAAHYGESVSVSRQAFEDGEGPYVRFTLRRLKAA